MTTPHMLDQSSRAHPPHRTDPVASLLVVLLLLVVVGLSVGAILAVYTYSTPDAEAPLLSAVAICFGVAIVLAVGGFGVRVLRRGRTW